MNTALGTTAPLTPPSFAAGLQVCSSWDGASYSDTYHNVTNAPLVTADQDFSGCLELLKTTGTNCCAIWEKRRSLLDDI